MHNRNMKNTVFTSLNSTIVGKGHQTQIGDGISTLGTSAFSRVGHTQQLQPQLPNANIHNTIVASRPLTQTQTNQQRGKLLGQRLASRHNPTSNGRMGGQPAYLASICASGAAGDYTLSQPVVPHSDIQKYIKNYDYNHLNSEPLSASYVEVSDQKHASPLGNARDLKDLSTTKIDELEEQTIIQSTYFAAGTDEHGDELSLEAGSRPGKRAFRGGKGVELKNALQDTNLQKKHRTKNDASMRPMLSSENAKRASNPNANTMSIKNEQPIQ